MNWKKIVLGGLAGGVVAWLADGVLHGVVMVKTYTRLNQVFTQTEANPLWFLLINVAISVSMAALFARTRSGWAAGVKGGLTFGLFAGALLFFQFFFDPLVIDGFPYYLAWCEGGMAMIDALLIGSVLGAVIKS